MWEAGTEATRNNESPYRSHMNPLIGRGDLAGLATDAGATAFRVAALASRRQVPAIAGGTAQLPYPQCGVDKPVVLTLTAAVVLTERGSPMATLMVT